MIRLLVATALLLLATSSAYALERFWLAAQHSFSEKRGFYLNFENDAGPDRAGGLGDLRLVAGAGNGAEWHFLSRTIDWQLDHDYRVSATLGQKSGSLMLDGTTVGSGDTRFVAYPGPAI